MTKNKELESKSKEVIWSN